MKSIEKILKPNTEAYRKVQSALMNRLQMAESEMNKRYTAWEEAEKLFTAYMPEKEADASRASARKNQGMPQYTTIEVPYSYASLLAAHTYYTSVFLGRDPILQYQGRHGEGQDSEMAIEALMNYQLTAGNNLVPLFIWLLDPGKYGMGVVGYYWDHEKVSVARYVDQQESFLGVPYGPTKKVMERVELDGYVGCKLYNVRPADFFFDPRKPAYQFQDGEFCGRYVDIAFTTLRLGEKNGQYFNVDQLRDVRQGSGSDGGIITRQKSERSDNRGVNELPKTDPYGFGKDDETSVGNIACFEIYVRLIPKDWGIDDGESLEIWVFTISNTGVIVGCQPLGEFHNRFPFAMMEYEPDGYSVFTRGMIETIQPLNYILSWLFNTHFYNVRKAINDQFLVDPSKVVMKDLTDPNAGRLIRLRPEAYGTDVRLAVTQFQTSDVTNQHVSDSSLVVDLMQKAIGVNDNIMGAVNTGSRKTATEVRNSTSFGVNRLKTNCEYFSAMGFGPLAQLMLQTTQQRMDTARKYRIVGDLAQFVPEQYMNVSPESIAGFFDFVPVDGTMPVDRFAQANLWQQILAQGARYPQIMQNYDLGRIFGWVGQLAGLKNINRFRINIVPDGQAQAGEQSGNLVPMRGMPPDQMPQGQQIPGMGSMG